MKEKLQLKKSDFDRVILTELLPYETPIIFSNRKLYEFKKLLFATPAKVNQDIKKIFDLNRVKETIAYEYSIRQGASKTRTLGIMHPAHQLRFPNFYERYESLILSLCQRSNFSLRYPVRVASYFYANEHDDVSIDDADELKNDEVELEAKEDNASKYAGSYFYYSRYNQLYKFVDSTEFLSLERRFHRLLKFDIKRCFSSIYTHSISWAVKDKEFAKQHRGISFDGEFDRLMQQANHNETNGIVVGPEISRVFAELILQKVDLEISRRASGADIQKSDYEVRRYLDDYFLFTSKPEHEGKLFSITQQCLQEYKMYINEAKTSSFNAPFITPQSIVKSDVQAYLKDTVLSALKTLRREIIETHGLSADERRARKFKLSLPTSTRLIRDIKISLSRSEQGFDVVSSYSLSSILRGCYRLQKTITKHRYHSELQLTIQNLLGNILEVAFYIYSMDFRVRTTYLISQILIVIGKLSQADERLSISLQTRIKILAKTVLDSRASEELGGVEISNLLVAMRFTIPDHLYTTEELKTYFQFSEKGGKNCLKYFDFIALLYYIGERHQYASFKNEICQKIKSRFAAANSDAILNTELTLLFFDLMACPHLGFSFKYEIGRMYLKRAIGSQPDDNAMLAITRFCKKHLHFVSWSSDLELEKLLLRKQLSPGY